MEKLQASLICLLVTFDLIIAQRLSRCQPCEQGYFVSKNCSVTGNWKKGVQCQPCTDCSGFDRVTLVNCSTFADSLCGQGRPTDIIRTSKSLFSVPHLIRALSLVLVLLLMIILIMMFCRKHHQDMPKGLDLL